jgi:hypothetical protein
MTLILQFFPFTGAVALALTLIKVLEFQLEDAVQHRAKEAEMMTRVLESARIAGEQKVARCLQLLSTGPFDPLQAEAAKDEVAHLERVLSREIQVARNSFSGR